MVVVWGSEKSEGLKMGARGIEIGLDIADEMALLWRRKMDVGYGSYFFARDRVWK
jgi:hypothetical protein